MELPAFLRRVPVTVAVIDAGVAALSATLVREKLIPDNLEVLGVIAPLLIVAAFFVTAAYHDRLRHWLRPLALGSVVALLALLLLHTEFVHAVEPYGATGGRHDFLVGYRYTEQGQIWRDSLQSISISGFIADAGHDLIRPAWGASFIQIAAAYSVAYLAFIFCVVLALGATELGASPADGHAPAAPATLPPASATAPAARTSDPAPAAGRVRVNPEATDALAPGAPVGARAGEPPREG